MNIEQMYTGCLAQGAYFIESNGEVAIIDPLREVQQYIDKADSINAKIKYVFETHFHADFVSGHITLSEKTGAPIVYGPTAEPKFDAIIAEDGQTFKVGDLTIVALHTPGHTMESTTYLLKDSAGKNKAIFTGDTLFLGDVGRPDLAQKREDMSKEKLAGILFDSLRNKIMPLEDDITVYPAHGAGSACGKNMSSETVDTLGSQKESNYALRADMTKEEFVKEVTDGLLPPPGYFPMNVKMNKEGYKDIEAVIEKGENALQPDAFEKIANASLPVILDVRHQDEFEKGHIPKSIFIGLNGNFAPWVGDLIKDVQQPILLVAEKEDIKEAIIRLSRVGFDNVLGYLEGGFNSWKAAGKEIDTVDSINAAEFEQAYNAKPNNISVIDVRKVSEYEDKHVSDAKNAPLRELNEYLSEIPTDKTSYVHCAGGYRSMIASSILKSRGIHSITNIKGGFSDIKETEVELS